MWFGKNGKGRPRVKTYLSETEGVSAWSWWPHAETGHNQEAKKEINSILGSEASFDTPKPTRLIERMLQIATNSGDLILDSFAGSGTTAHAVLKLNSASPEQEPRHFILVELESTIARNITRERIKRVTEGYKNSKGEPIKGLGSGFRYATLGDQLFDEHGRINELKISFTDLARHVYFSETGEPLPKEHITSKTPLLGVHHGQAVYLLYNGILKDKTSEGGNVLTSTTLEHLPPHDGPKVVYAAACRFSKARLEAEQITFKQTPYAIRTR